MGLISAGNNNEFIPASFIYSQVRSLLSSFDAANMINEGEFPTYTKTVLNNLGIGAFMEEQALLPVVNYKVTLPSNYKYLYVAYKCSPIEQTFKGERKHLQGTGFEFVTESKTTFVHNDQCYITCNDETLKDVQKISVQNYVVEGQSDCLQFGNIVPLRLSPNVSRSQCVDDGMHFLQSSPLEITITRGILSANFTDDYIYMKYYGFPIDADGELLIPENQHVQDAIKWFIVYQILLSGWFNSSIPDIQNKAQEAERLYNNEYAEAKYLNKLGTFADSINTMRMRRSNNKLAYMSSQYINTNFQRTR